MRSESAKRRLTPVPRYEVYTRNEVGMDSLTVGELAKKANVNVETMMQSGGSDS
jgi:hypothetical protein